MRRAGRVGELRSTAVNRVLADVRAVQAQGKDVVSLMRGQPDSSTPAHIVDAAVQALQKGRTGYPDNLGEPTLRNAVAQKLARDNGLKYDPASEILITDGATGGLCAALGALVEPGDEVLLPDPIYDAYASPIALWGGRPIGVPAKICDGRFTIDRAALEEVCTPRTRVLLINSPWNPVGTVFSREELRSLMDFAARRDLLVISDEIYETLVYDGRQHVSPATLSDDARQRTLVVNSLSKTYAMTGWRVGYCAGPAEIIQSLLMVWQQSSRGPATFVQDAAACALQSDQSGVRQMTAEYQARRDFVLTRLRDISGVTPLVPEGGLFVMLDVRDLCARSPTFQKSRASESTSDSIRQFLLHEAGVVVIHGSAYGPGGEGTLRVSFAAGGDTLSRGLDRLREGLLRLAE